MPKHSQNLQVPFRGKDMLDYDGYYYNPGDIRKVDNFEFTGSLVYDRCARRRSACHFYFKRPDGGQVTFFLGEFEKLIPYMSGGIAHGTFTFIKRGANFSCRIIRDTNGQEIQH